MNLPLKFEVLIITLSDRAYRGEYKDLSGPRIGEKISEYISSIGWEFEITYSLIPDDPGILEELLRNAGEKYNLIITTGGTGIGPRDITVETVVPLLSKGDPGNYGIHQNKIRNSKAKCFTEQGSGRDTEQGTDLYSSRFS